MRRKSPSDPVEGQALPGFAIGPEQPKSPGGGRRAAAIVVPLVLVAVVVAVSVVFLLGVVKFGKPSLSGSALASQIDSSRKPVDTTSRFSADDAAIYCCANVRAFGDTLFEARWYRTGLQVGYYKGRFGAMAGAPPVKFLPTGGRVAFKLERPKDGWAGGPYSVRIMMNGKRAAALDFMVSEAAPEGLIGARYTDPSGAFSIIVPDGWRSAEAASIGGGLAGFIAPSAQSAYPPRFVVSSTDYASADVAYLNEQIKQASPKPTEVFAGYSLGETPAARRTFDWDFKIGDQQYGLRTIQVVVQKGGKVYSIDCHSLATDFAKNEKTFNAIIETFK